MSLLGPFRGSSCAAPSRPLRAAGERRSRALAQAGHAAGGQARAGSSCRTSDTCLSIGMRIVGMALQSSTIALNVAVTGRVAEGDRRDAGFNV